MFSREVAHNTTSGLAGTVQKHLPSQDGAFFEAGRRVAQVSSSFANPPTRTPVFAARFAARVGFTEAS